MEISQTTETQVDSTKLVSICKISNGFLHQFCTENVRQLVDICDSQILQHVNVQGTEVPSHYIKAGQLTQRVDDCIYVMATFQNLITFIFENKQNQNSLYFLSFQTYNPDLQSFCQTLKSSTNVVDYKTDNYQKTSIKEKVSLICGGEVTQEMIENVGSFNSIFKTVGNILGSVAKNIADPTSKAQTILQNGMSTISERYVSQQNKNRWGMIKQGASNLNVKMTEMYKPIDNAFKWISSSISQNFSKSQNKYIKNFKNFGISTAKTLNNSYKKAQQQFLGNQGKQNQANPQAQLHEQSTNNLEV